MERRQGRSIVLHLDREQARLVNGVPVVVDKSNIQVSEKVVRAAKSLTWINFTISILAFIWFALSATAVEYSSSLKEIAILNRNGQIVKGVLVPGMMLHINSTELQMCRVGH